MTIPTFKLSASEALLCDVLADCEPEARKEAARRFVEELGDEQAFALAQANGVSTVVAHALMDAYGAGNVPEHWVRVHEENFSRISAYLTELDRVAKRLAEDGIIIVLLENGVLAKAVYPCLGCFKFGDLDLLIRKDQLAATHRIIISEGYKAVCGNPLVEHGITEGRIEYKGTLQSGYSMRLNVQWSLVARRWFDASREPDSNTLMKRSVLISGSQVRMLCAEDNLYQLTIHNASHGYVRKPGLGLHLDIDRFVRRTSFDWDKFIELVKKCKVKTPVFFSLLIPKILFKTPIPDEVIESLKPPRWKVKIIAKWLQKVSLFNPDEKKFGRIGYIVFTALLYDDLRGLWHSIFPGRDWMVERYGAREGRSLFGLHLKRLVDLAFRHINT